MKSIAKRIITLFSLFLVLVLTIPSSPVAVLASASGETAESEKLDLLFLHDTHSHLDTFTTVNAQASVDQGGFARIKTLIDQAKAQNPDTLILDAGDFSMGTLVQTIFSSDSPELRMLGLLGCEVTTLGNHEFDYRSSGLAGALDAARDSGDPIPALVLCNINWETMEAEGLTEDQKLLKEAFDAYGMKDYVVITKGDINIAVLGVFGIDSLACAPTCVLKFRDASEAAAETVKEIQKKEDVQMIICVSHSGTNATPSKSEDEILAKAVPQIDLIVSGHTHTELPEPIRHGNTYIVSCGEYGKNLGSLSMRRETSGRWTIENYELISITPEIPQDTEIQEKIDDFMEIVNDTYLSRFGWQADDILAQNTISFTPSQTLYDVQGDYDLGNILSDAFTYAVESAPDFDGHPVDVSIVPSGCVRDTFTADDITVTDVFNAYSLGIGLDGIAGYPLISIWLTGEELKIGAEIDASVSDFMPSARLYTSGMNYSFNPHRLILNRITDCYLTDSAGNRVELEDEKLYRVVCDLYSGQMLGAVTDVSYGILSIQPKFEDGTPIENIEDAIITSQGQEIKAWAAIAKYMENLPDTDGDGIANIPEYYATTHGRKVIEESTSIGDLVKNPNKYAVIIVVILIVVIAIVIVAIMLIVKLIKKMIRRMKKGRS